MNVIRHTTNGLAWTLELVAFGADSGIQHPLRSWRDQRQPIPGSPNTMQVKLRVRRSHIRFPPNTNEPNANLRLPVRVRILAAGARQPRQPAAVGVHHPDG